MQLIPFHSNWHAFWHDLVLYPHVNRHQNIVRSTYCSYEEAKEEGDRIHWLADILRLGTKLHKKIKWKTYTKTPECLPTAGTAGNEQNLKPQRDVPKTH